MKQRIEQLANGIFEYEKPVIRPSIERIEEIVRPGGEYQGSFVIGNSAKRQIKGFLYSSDARVACRPQEFSGLNPKISFFADFSGLRQGETLKGTITLCTNMGESKIPFCFELKDREAHASKEQPDDLESFVTLARENYSRAYMMFGSEAFREMILERYPAYAALYRGIASCPMDFESLEKFLTGAGKKEHVRVKLCEDGRTFEEISGSVQENLKIVKSGWGFLRLQISSDAEFIKPVYSVISTDDFLGSSFRLEYVIDEKYMHAGRNFGRIRIRTLCREMIYTVEARKKEGKERKGQLHLQRRQVERLYADYTLFRLKRINIHEWIERAGEAIDEYERAGGKSVMLQLYQVQLCFAAGQPEKACALLDSLEEMKAIPNLPTEQGYYQYLTTFHGKDMDYVDAVQRKVEELLIRNPEEWVLQWILLYMRETLLESPSRKLDAVRSQYMRGCRSRMMYLEAACIYRKSPLLLKRLDDFELRTLRFMCTNDLLDKEIVMQVADLAGRQRQYSEKLYRILLHCHVKYPSKSVVNAVCSLLIKGHKTGSAYFNWYEKGVAEGLRLTGLYEYYMESMGKERGGLLPKMIRMYFAYDNAALNYDKRATLYANIIENQERDPHTFEMYRPVIEKFMIDQLAVGQINRGLALMYRTFLTENMMSRVMAQNLSRAMFTWEVRCESEEAAGIGVVHRQLRDIQIFRLQDHVANVQIYTQDASIFVVDREGNRCFTEIPYTAERLLEDERLYNMCRKLAPESPGFLLHFCSEAEQGKLITGERAAAQNRLLAYDEIQKRYKKQLCADVLNYYYENRNDAALCDFLRRMDRELFARIDRKKTIELLIAYEMDSEAFALIKKYGSEDVCGDALAQLCKRIVPGTEEDQDMLLYLCFLCVERGKYDREILAYLLERYDGPAEAMKQLWKAGNAMDMDTSHLEEKIFIMLLFTGTGLEDTGEIFESYRQRPGKQVLLTGYINLISYEYFVKERPAEAPVFIEIERRMEEGWETEFVCRLALLKYGCAQGDVSDILMSKIVQECHDRQIYFPFFARLSDARQMFCMEDGCFVEYRTRPGAKVSLSYELCDELGQKGERRLESMREMYEGIFVKKFVLFDGEKVVCTICEEENGVLKEVEERTLKADARTGAFEKDRLGRKLNEMCDALLAHQEGHMRELGQEYLERICMAEKLFPIA